MKITFSISILYIILVSKIAARANLKIQLISFLNNNGRLYNGKCCDFLCNKCDHRFEFCLDVYSGSPSIDQCKYYRHQTSEYQNTNYIYFRNDISGVPNPFDTEVDKWPGRVTFKIRVLDDDTSHSAHDLVDTYNFMVEALKPFSSLAKAQWSSALHANGRRNGDPTSLQYRYMVYCDTNYFGEDCSHYCKAQDDDTSGHYTCDPDTGDKICLPEYEDPFHSCRAKKDDCIGVQCQHGGICVDGIKSYMCNCTSGYTGHNCETEVNECDSNPCMNDGVCKHDIGTYTCVCPPQWTGSTCQLHVCLNRTYCQNGGTCFGISDVKCLCPKGYTGDRCEMDLCDFKTCQNGGTCVKGVCQCLPGYFDSECATDRCDPSFTVCENGGTCDIGVCKCAAGFKGRFCQQNIDDCLAAGGKPCQNDGTCADDVGYFTCRCLPDFDGDRCQRSLVPSWEKDTPPPPSPPTPAPKENALPVANGGNASSAANAGFSWWMIVIIVVVVLLVLAILLIVLLTLKYRKKAKKARENGNLNPAYMPQDIDSMAQARAQAANQQTAMQQAAAVQLAAAQLQAAYAQQNPNVVYGRQTSNQSSHGHPYLRQDSTSSTAALIQPRGSRGSLGNTAAVAGASGYSGLDNMLNAKLNNLDTASNVGSTRTSGGGNLYDDPDRLIRKGRLPPPPPVDLDIVAAAKASAGASN